HPGDIVYMPLEYDWYLDNKLAAMTGPDAALMVHGDKLRLLSLGWERTLRAVFSFDLPFIISGLSEMALQRAGVQRRVGLQTLTAQGDETGHTTEKATAYLAYIASLDPSIPPADAFAAPSYAKQQIVTFLTWARQHGVAIIGGLPTAIEDAPVSDTVIAAIRRIFETEGGSFL